MTDTQTVTLAWASVEEIQALLKSGTLTVSEIAEYFIERIERINPEINAYVSFDPADIRAQAAALDAKKASGAKVGPLFGIPYSIKLLTSIEGLPGSSGLLPFKDALGVKDAVVVERMRAADGLFLGQTNAPETGYYGGTDNHVYGPTHNPWKHGHTAGGSSGGAAAALAAGLCTLAEGADGAGSVRIPSAMCGVVGFKPSLGRIPHTLLDGRFYTFIFHGPLARSAEDAAAMLDVMAGEHEADPTTLPDPAVPYVNEVKASIEGMRIAYAPTMGTTAEVDPEVDAIVREALKAFTELGATVVEASPDWGDPEEAMWNALWVPGYSSEVDLMDWDAHKDEVDPQLYELIKSADDITLADFGRADVFRGKMYDTYVEFMKDYDLVVSPTLANAAFSLDRFAPENLDGTSLRRQLLGWLLTYPFNMLTMPAISVPAGHTSDGRPVGLQIGGRFRADGPVLAAAARFQQAHPVSTRAID